MNDKVNSFPIYRKLTNSVRVYQILNDRSFNEKQRLGAKVLDYSVIASQYPEMLRIQDMISCIGFEKATSEEWENY
ncbi:MAG: hypothetical protein KJ941_08190 [Bacteroidetes bacterium]|nr:hypothetical protein [Bacteroidota bacterium]